MIKKILITLICTYIPLSHAETILGDNDSCLPEKNYIVVNPKEAIEFNKKMQTGDISVYKSVKAPDSSINEVRSNKNDCEPDIYCEGFDAKSYSFVEYELDTPTKKGIYTASKYKISPEVRVCDDTLDVNNGYCFKFAKNEDNKSKAEYQFFQNFMEDGTAVERLYNTETKQDVYNFSMQNYKDARKGRAVCQTYYKYGLDDDKYDYRIIRMGMIRQ